MKKNNWLIVLGGSSGFGLASAKCFANHGHNVCIIHRDRRARQTELDQIDSELKTQGSQTIWLNADASLPNTIQEAIKRIKETSPSARVGCLLHCIARGNVKPMTEKGKRLSRQDLQVTSENMAFNLLDWVNALHDEELFAEFSSVVSLTSEGSSRAIPNYAAVGAAKSALEALSRSIALEYATFGIRSNVIQAGVCRTPSFEMIPGHEDLASISLKRNPMGRLTTPEDVAGVVYFLSTPESRWINGAVIPVDGGESIA